jgi:hypothetical protein
MENSDGFLSKSTKIQKTRIVPLRWIGNYLGGYAGNHLIKAIDLDEALDSNLGFRYKYHAKMWKMLNKPYTWWGTYYELDIKGMMDDLKLDGAGWDDYDEFGKAYWENEGGPVDNSEERLKYMEDNGI